MKTPEGTLKTPSIYASLDTEDARADLGLKLPNAEFECSLNDKEAGFGPISVLLTKLVPGRYHVYAHCKPKMVDHRDVGWPDSSAEVRFYGSEQEALAWSGSSAFRCPREGAGDWWDLCFLTVQDDGSVSVTEFNTYTSDEPGYRSITITTLDVAGTPVPGTKVVCQMESDAYKGTGDFGDTDDNGEVELKLPLGNYTASISHLDFVASAAKLTVDLAPMADKVTIPMVKASYFQNPGDMLCVLTGGDGSAQLKIETPGRCVWQGPSERAIAAGAAAAAADGLLEAAGAGGGGKGTFAPMTLTSASSLQSCMITRASGPTCPWVGSAAAEDHAELLKDSVYVYYPGDLDHANMQLSLFSVDGMEFSQAPPSADDANSPYWSVCTLEAGRVCALNSRSKEDPATGQTFCIRPLAARPNAEADVVPPAACGITLTKTGETKESDFVFWNWPAPEAPPTAAAAAAPPPAEDGSGEETKADGGDAGAGAEGAAAEGASKGDEAAEAAPAASTEGVAIERTASDPEPAPPRPPQKEHRVFLPFGSYNLEATCETEKCHPISITGITVGGSCDPSLGFVIPRKDETDAKSALMTLSWGRSPTAVTAAGGDKPDDLQLCIATGTGGTIEGLVSTDGLGPGLKPIKNVSSVAIAANAGEGYGPKVINASQPISGRAKLFVTNNSSDPAVFEKCNPIVNIWFYNGLFKSFRPPAEGGSGKSWYICDMAFSSDNKMEKQSLECTERNKIIPDNHPALSWD